MFDYSHYVPILRWKRAERIALRELYDPEREYITPLIELMPKDFLPKGDSPPPEPERILSKKAEEVQENWGAEPLFVDLLHLDPRLRSSQGIHPMKILGQEMRTRQVSLIPVTGLGRETSYQSAVASVIREDGQGACLRLHPADFMKASLADDLETLVARFKLKPREVHLLVDFQADVQSPADISSLYSSVPDLESWKTLTFAGGAFPENLTEFAVGQHLHPRNDWLAWRRLVLGRSLPRRPTYADYTIQYGIFKDPPAFSNPSASIRYTSDQNWVIMRGEGLRNKGGPGHAQYSALAELLCGRQEYCGQGYSYGDDYIHEKYMNSGPPGSAETWLRAGINHHVTFTIRQIRKLFSASLAAAP